MTCKDCIYYAKGCEFVPSDLDSDVFDYCRKGITDEIPDIEERCNDFENKTDWVKVVRCKDCKLSSEPKTVSRYELYCNNYDVRFCVKEQKIVCRTHFCSYGER